MTISLVCLVPLWGQGNRRIWGKISAPQAENFGLELQMRSAAPYRDDGSSCVRACPPPEMTPCSARRRASRALLRFSLFVPISASRFRRASARASRSLSGSLEERTNQQCSARASCVFTEDLFFPLPLPGAAGFKKYGPAHQGRGIACTVLEPAL